MTVPGDSTGRDEPELERTVLASCGDLRTVGAGSKSYDWRRLPVDGATTVLKHGGERRRRSIFSEKILKGNRRRFRVFEGFLVTSFGAAV